MIFFLFDVNKIDKKMKTTSINKKSLEHVLDSKELNYDDYGHDNHFSGKNPIIFLLIFIKLAFHFIMLIENLLEFPSCFSNFD